MKDIIAEIELTDLTNKLEFFLLELERIIPRSLLTIFRLFRKLGCSKRQGSCKSQQFSKDFQREELPASPAKYFNLKERAEDLKTAIDVLLNATINSAQEKSKDRKQLLNEKKNHWKCTRCRKRFSDAILLEFHCRKLHDIEIKDSTEAVEVEQDVPFQCCKICFLTYRTKDELVFHVCPLSGNRNEDVAKPVNPKHREISKSISESAIGSSDVLEKHNKFFCGYCKEEFRQFTRVKFHLSKCLGGPLVCEICNFQSLTRKDLNCHKSESHCGQLSFRCDECDAQFERNTSLQKHLINKHEKDTSRTSFQCDRCPKKFVKKLYLTHHKTRFHNLQKPFLCQVCGDGFLASNSLRDHLRIHESIKKYCCTYCNKGFGRKDKLESHLTIHTGMRTHHCQLCSRTFATKFKLDEHSRRHTGEKRFACLVCQKMYSGSNALRGHLTRCHPKMMKPLSSNSGQL